MHHRSKFPGTEMSPFSLFSEDGDPLALRSVNAILGRLVKCFPKFNEILSPHVLRYTCNDMLSESAAAAGINSETLEPMRRYLDGWRLTATRVNFIRVGRVEERAAQISLTQQRSLFA